MASTDVELEQQLKEAGKQLSHPPDSVDDLLPVLDQVEKLLSKVDQSPKKSMLDALKPSMKALIHDSLLKHSDVDVNVAVASCVSEITRITAPDAPYTDDQMKDVFRLIVSSFEHLADQSSRSYNKRASILETVSKVRSCVIMLDLECDGLIVEMFEHFLRSVRDYHLDSVYSSMENIMVLVLEESEEISAEMLKPLLASVKKDNEGILPVARKLGEGVLLKSADKLKPYLMPAVISLGDTLDKYTKIVASVCEGTTATFERNDENSSGLQPANESKVEKESIDEAQQADESKLTTASSDHTDQVAKDETCPEEVDPTLEQSPKSIMSNGVKATVNEEASVDQEPSMNLEDKDVNQENLDDKEGTDDLNDEKESKPEEQTSKKMEKKDDTVINSTEPSDSSHIEGEKEEADKPSSEIEAVVPSEIEKDSEDVQVKKVVRSKSGTPPDETRVKKASGRVKNKGLTLTEEDAPEKRSGKKAVVVRDVKIPLKDESEDGSDSDAKPLKKSGSKSTKQSGKKSKQSNSKKKVEEKKDESDSDDKPLKLSVTKGEKSKVAIEEDDESDSENKPIKLTAKKANSKKKEDGRKRKNVAENDQAKSLSEDDEMDSSPKSATKSAKGEGNSKETPVTSAKRKRSTGKPKVSDTIKYDKSLVGLKVKVWWPEDKMYYEGVIESFDSAKKKHKVSYVDGDEETLNLKTQEWEILQEFSVRDEEQEQEQTVEAQSEEASPETNKKKKSKTDPAPSASQEKIKSSAKRVKGSASKDNNKSKDNSGAKSASQKTGGKSSDAAVAVSKEAGKSKEDEETPKTGTKTSKTVNKSKGNNNNTPQSGGKSNGPTKAKSGSANVKESEDVKTPGGSMSGKKRKKRA